MKAFWQDVSTKNASALDGYMRSLGQTRLLEFGQNLSGKTYLVTYVKENSGIGPTFKENRQLDMPVARYVRDQFSNFLGYDFTASQNAPDVEKVWEWTDPDRSGPARIQSAFAIPVKSGETGDLKHLYTELKGPRKDAETQHLRYQTIAKIASFIQHRPEGDYLVQYIESDEPLSVVMQKAVGAGTPIAAYIKEQLSAETELNPSGPGPDISLLYDWSAGKGLQAAAPSLH
jgi:hypothetical protein